MKFFGKRGGFVNRKRANLHDELLIFCKCLSKVCYKKMCKHYIPC